MTLSDWRRQIDEIDRKLVELLNQRSRCALEVGKIKQAENLPLYQPEREREVLENAERINSGPLTDAAEPSCPVGAPGDALTVATAVIVFFMV